MWVVADLLLLILGDFYVVACEFTCYICPNCADQIATSTPSVGLLYRGCITLEDIA